MRTRPVLQQADIQRALTRIAHEIVEGDPAAELVLLGIPTRGAILAARLAGLVAGIEGGEIAHGALDVTMYRDDLSRHPTRTPRPTVLPSGGIDDKVVVLVDDVLYSGRSIRAALDALGDYGRPRAVRLAVLVDRGHRELPIRADYVGKNLPSSREERINVRLEESDGIDEVAIQDVDGTLPDRPAGGVF